MSLVPSGVKTGVGMEARKETDPSEWYRQVLFRSEMIEYYSVSGCYILRPAAFSIWEYIQDFLNIKIRKSGVRNCYFPMLVTEDSLCVEKDHIEGFAPEVAWITKAGSSELEKPLAVRPTSETIMYPYYAKWIKSHRDLPLRLNQWCNVLRWEFKDPQPFLRTREFLWQEGHSAFLTKKEADSEVLEILKYYQQVYEDLLAIPVIPGKKSEKEKFAGADYTTTVEAYVPASGRGIQGATSHCLGQNFAKMFEILAECEDNTRQLVWQNSWGLTTRTIGVMVMIHSDNRGLVLPPRVASMQVVIVICGITASTNAQERQNLTDAANKIVNDLAKVEVRASADLRENCSPGNKFNHWELRGIPLRIEIGPRDLKSNQIVVVRRDDGSKNAMANDSLMPRGIADLLDQIHNDMYKRAKTIRDSKLKVIEEWESKDSSFCGLLDDKNLVLAPWCTVPECEESIKERSKKSNESTSETAPSMGAKSLCIPFDQPGTAKGKKCFAKCGRDATDYALFGRSY